MPYDLPSIVVVLGKSRDRGGASFADATAKRGSPTSVVYKKFLYNSALITNSDYFHATLRYHTKSSNNRTFISYSAGGNSWIR